MKLSRFERWMLANQYRILEKIDPDEAQHYAEARQAFENGYELHYEWLAEGIFDDPHIMSEFECREVIDILSMFSALHHSFEALPDKSGIDKARIKFLGFSGNDETKQMGYANYFCKRQGGAFPELDRTH